MLEINERDKKARSRTYCRCPHINENEVALIIYLLMEQLETLIQLKKNRVNSIHSVSVYLVDSNAVYFSFFLFRSLDFLFAWIHIEASNPTL